MHGPIALTGSTGFVGRHLIKALEDAGYPLRLLVRQGPRDCGFGTAETIVGGLEDETALRRLVAGARAVIHLAGAIAAPDRATFFAVNVQGTERLAAAARAAGVERFIHVSSLAAREPQLSDYAASKRQAEDMLLAQPPKGLLILRPPVVYGPGDRATLPLLGQLTRRIAVIPAAAAARFSLLYAGDLAKFLMAQLEEPTTGLCEIDDGRPNGYGWTDLVKDAAETERREPRLVFLPRWLLQGLAWPVSLLGAALTLRVPLTPGKVRELYHRDWVARGPDAGLADAVQFDEGFRLTIAWYREQGWLPANSRADRRQSPTFHGESIK